jgi:hypothetical protein
VLLDKKEFVQQYIISGASCKKYTFTLVREAIEAWNMIENIDESKIENKDESDKDVERDLTEGGRNTTSCPF